jgi:hypothetical protein
MHVSATEGAGRGRNGGGGTNHPMSAEQGQLQEGDYHRSVPTLISPHPEVSPHPDLATVDCSSATLQLVHFKYFALQSLHF